MSQKPHLRNLNVYGKKRANIIYITTKEFHQPRPCNFQKTIKSAFNLPPVSASPHTAASLITLPCKQKCISAASSLTERCRKCPRFGRTPYTFSEFRFLNLFALSCILQENANNLTGLFISTQRPQLSPKHFSVARYRRMEHPVQVKTLCK